MDDKVASSGVIRANARWTFWQQGENTSSFVATLDHRHRFRDIAPADLAGDAGCIGVTGTMYSGIDFAVVNLNWQQGFNEGRTGLLAGRYDPNDYMGVLGYTNPDAGLSPRSLQRRLAGRGRSFQALLDEARLEGARERIGGTTEPLLSIALDLGYQDAAAFSRAFRRWAGMPPSEYRKSIGAQQAA